ncbi:NUDIX hydrolase [Chroogloeocystis siderophila]|uniref:ADP-ribose pyrophosphatase n=1 Tax=Chroogloeocystis siderophila 5.2 s.c.1 TaxID=247279 RepID=A0A1U7HJ81_9CHRO|nr:NUDIX hydrolase [Chroogloeocystis siderophila]OKH23627.1 ADP-ribose pyrophosphatase [Chroogloeocystis siderophila 5.2 s.c.1]
MSLKWLEWSQKLQAIAQTGLTYTQSPYDIERYQQIRQIAAEIMATYAHETPTYVYDLLNKEEGYATPKVDVRGVVFHNDQILLVQEREDGCWTLPGGWVDVGESPSQAVIREVYEESGYQTRIIKLLALYDRNHPRHNHPPLRHHVYKLFFQCQISGGNAAESTETAGAAFFKEQEIPELSLTRVVPSQISRLFAHYRHPEWQPDFD